MALTKSQLNLLVNISSKLGVNPYWLYTLIDFESKWKPRAKNPYSSARGLLQFIDSTAIDLGYRSSADLVEKNPTIESQLQNPVYNYLVKYKPFPTKQSLYMSVFYPKARNWSPFQRFPESLIKVNPGIDTVQSYVDKVEKKNYRNTISVIIALSLIIFLLRHRKRREV